VILLVNLLSLYWFGDFSFFFYFCDWALHRCEISRNHHFSTLLTLCNQNPMLNFTCWKNPIFTWTSCNLQYSCQHNISWLKTKEHINIINIVWSHILLSYATLKWELKRFMSCTFNLNDREERLNSFYCANNLW